MNVRHCFSVLVLFIAALLGCRWLDAAQPPNFDRLSNEDRAALQKRFEREVWPLLVSGGKNGCVGCHNGKIVSALRMSGDATKDFRMLLRDGFFLKGDAGSLLSRITDRDLKRRMPPRKYPAWPAADVKILDDFVRAVDSKQKP